MNLNNAGHKRADLASTPRPFSSNSTSALDHSSNNDNTPLAIPNNNNNNNHRDDEKLKAAQSHRDKLLSFQSQNARRTHIIDEAADYETPVSGQNIWASPTERATQLKKQQKVLREQEWNAKPEFEKRKVVVSIDVKSGKAVREMVGVEGPQIVEDENYIDESEAVPEEEGEGGGKGAFSRNPLLGGMVRPVWKSRGDEGMAAAREQRERSKWRRVQDDDTDNEAWILDGGVYGGGGGGRDGGEGGGDGDAIVKRLGAEEHAFG